MNNLRLPNAKEGEAYQASILEAIPQKSAIKLLAVTFNDDTGLGAILSEGIIAGTPNCNGLFSLEVRYQISLDSTGRVHTQHLALLIAPNPKLLWKNLPSDKAGLFASPDEKAACLNAANYCAIAASKRGRSHAHAGGYREDDFQMASVDGWFLCAVCDGAGSSKYSRRAAAVISHQAINCLATGVSALDACMTQHANAQPYNVVNGLKPAANDLMQTLVTQSLAAIDSEMQLLPHQALSIKDFASTLLLLACKQFASGWLCVTFSVGDGAIGVLSDAQLLASMADSDTGEFSGQTRFLDERCLQEIAARTQVALFASATNICVMTDGVSDEYFESSKAVVQASSWSRLIADLNRENCRPGIEGAELRLLQWLDFWSYGNHDDRTIVFMSTKAV